MKVVMINYDYKVFWKGRLVYLHEFLATKNINFNAIELFGKGSAYSFDTYNNKENWWTCLFPTNSADEISKKKLKKAFFDVLDRINPDIIIASSVAFYAGALGIRWAKKNEKKFIMFENAKPSQFKRNIFVQSVKDLIIEQSDALWLPSDDYKKEYDNFYHKNILFFYGYCCVDNNLFTVKEEKEFTNHRILCIARLVPIKNIPTLLRAWQFIEQKGIDYKLSIIGDGPDYTVLKELCGQLGLKKVEFLGAVENSKISSFFNISDAFILPSLSETWGLVVNEAMAAGTPILLSNQVNAAHTLLKSGINGFDFDPLNVDEMAQAIFNYINLDIQAKKNMSIKSLEIIDTMSYEKMGFKLLEALIKIKSQKFKKTGLVAKALINVWDGRYSVSAWDKL